MVAGALCTPATVPAYFRLRRYWTTDAASSSLRRNGGIGGRGCVPSGR